MFKYISKDLPASVVVFFVALPLCLGIALASGAPLFSGIIAGIVGGLIVGSISKSSLGVSGPAAGLAVIVLSAIASLGFNAFLVAVVIAGGIQILLGVLKAGIIGYYFPSSVIKGMLAGIGIIIFMKQIPVALGLPKDFTLFTTDVEVLSTNWSQLGQTFSLGAVVVTLISLAILMIWQNVLSTKHKFFQLFPAPLVAVIIGVVYYLIVPESSGLGISGQNLVTVPVPKSASDFLGQLSLPDFSVIGNSEIWITAVTLAIVASLETLLSVEATDKLDPKKRVTPTNRELFAQGTGNIVSGLIGGLPVTQVIVRSSANIQSGGQTKLSGILHAVWLLLAVAFIPQILNFIPLGVLAAVLFLVGYKLAKPSLFKEMFKLGRGQFLPFIITILGIVLTDLLIGISLGLASGLLTVLYNSYKNSHFLHIDRSEGDKNIIKMTLAEEVTFFNKGAILRELNKIKDNSTVEIDVRNTMALDYDVLEILEDYSIKAENRNIIIKLISKKGVTDNPKKYKSYIGKDETAA